MEPEPPEVAGGQNPRCNFGRCSCRWLRLCSSRIPPVAPGRDYERVPLGGADDARRAALSLLIGFIPRSSAGTGASLLRLCRFRVERSGRVLGRSDDALDMLDDQVDYDAKGKSAQIVAAAATPSADSRRSLALCLFCWDFDVPGGKFGPPRPKELLLEEINADDRRTSLRSLPHLPPWPLKLTRPISAAGQLWAPAFLNHCGSSSLVMLRLDKESEQWVRVATMKVDHTVMYGYAVVHDTILLSLEPRRLFVVFNCTTHAWNAVKTGRNGSTFSWALDQIIVDYIPICGRGLYVEDDDTIYFLRNSIVYAYKLCQDQDQCQYQMAPPTIVDSVFPFRDEGSEFLTHLGGRVMCSVWISVPVRDSELGCDCDTPHVLITTFQVIGNRGSNPERFLPKGVQVLHSTCRRLHIDPKKSSASDYKFCFLQEYEENALPPAKKKRGNALTPSMSLELLEVPASSNVVEFPKMLTCCRSFFNQTRCMRALILENSVIKTTKDLYIICQAPSYSTVYKIEIMNGRLACHNKNLTAQCVLDTFVCADLDNLMEQPFPWHFVCDGTSICAVQDEMNDIHVFSLATGTVNSLLATRPVGTDFSVALVLSFGPKIIAISDTLEAVYHLSNTYEWECHSIQGSVLGRKVKLSGYVVLSGESFMVCDAETSRLFLFELDKDTWSIVTEYSDISRSLPIVPPTGWSGSGFLTRRSVFVQGFIYTCADAGLQAYEIIKVQDSFLLGETIFLEFPWRKYWDGNRMCLDYVGQDTTSGAVMLCVVQGNNYDDRPGAPPKHPVLITTIQIKTLRASYDTWKPVAVGHVNVGTFFVEREGGPIWTSSCFAF